MYHLTVHSHFAAAHNLLHYQGDCENLHGHNWKVEVTVGANQLDRSGLGVDFKVLKRETKKVLESLDHTYLNQLPDFQQVSPSSENIARYLFEKLAAVLNDGNVRVEKVNVWESDYACASFTQD
jgi:6-pyruvoyltetrahydropterin/6-carboxytetrahydropterin synthase